MLLRRGSVISIRRGIKRLKNNGQREREREESRERDIKAKRKRQRERERWGLSGYYATEMEKRARMLWRRHCSLRREEDSVE